MGPKLKYLTPEQKKFYEENGYILLSGILKSKEIDELYNEYNKIFDRKKKEDPDALETAWVGQDMKKAANNINYTVKSIHNFHMHSAMFTKFLQHEKILDAVEDIQGTPNLVLHHTKAHMKPPENGAPYLMHQDYPYFPFKNHTMCAVFIHMDDTTPENGGLCVYPGSHKLGPLPVKQLTQDGQVYHYVDPDKYPLDKAVPLTAKKGDVVIFSYLLLHGSYLNLSNRPRRMFLMQLRAAEDEPTKQLHHSHCQGLVLRGENVNFDASWANRYVDSVSNAELH